MQNKQGEIQGGSQELTVMVGNGKQQSQLAFVDHSSSIKQDMCQYASLYLLITGYVNAISIMTFCRV